MWSTQFWLAHCHFLSLANCVYGQILTPPPASPKGLTLLLPVNSLQRVSIVSAFPLSRFLLQALWLKAARAEL